MITPSQIATLQIEYPRRRQIFDESVAIIQQTNNPDVLFRRFEIVSEFVQWVFLLKKDGCPITIEKTQSQMNAELPHFFNFHCVRVAKYVSEHTPAAKRLKTLSNLQQSLKQASNKEDSFIQIAQLINKTLMA